MITSESAMLLSKQNINFYIEKALWVKCHFSNLDSSVIFALPMNEIKYRRMKHKMISKLFVTLDRSEHQEKTLIHSKMRKKINKTGILENYLMCNHR